jgi:anti-sigma28 factor (negative regulator of flagellin synthesis)
VGVTPYQQRLQTLKVKLATGTYVVDPHAIAAAIMERALKRRVN